MNKFVLKSKFRPAGDQPQAIAGLLKSLKKKRRYQTLLGVTGSGKSVAGNTRVLIKRAGAITIESIGELIDKLFFLFPEKSRYFNDTEIIFCDELPLKQRFETYSFDPETKQPSWKPVNQITRHQSPKKLFKIKTSCGRELDVTGDHNFYALRDGELSLLPSANLKIKDYLPLPLKLDGSETSFDSLYLPNCFGKNLKFYISLPNFKIVWQSCKNEARALLSPAKIFNILNHGERVSLPTYKKLKAIIPSLKKGATIGVYGKDYQSPLALKITGDLLRLFGYYIAEGHGDPKYFIISSADPEIISDSSDALKSLGLKLTHRTGSCDYQISSKFWSIFFGELCGQNSHNKRLPKFWTQLSNQQLAELLKAYFSGDGGINGNEITCTTASKTLGSDIMYALMRFGIIARTRERKIKIPNTKKRGTYWEIHISGQKFLKIFQEKIGFTLIRKNKKLKEIIKPEHNTNVDLIPLTSWWKKIRVSLRATQKQIAIECGFNRSFLSMVEHGKRMPSRQVARQMFVCMEKFGLKNRDETILSEIADKKNLLNLFWTPIKNISTIKPEKYVYDFSVQNNETFLAGFGGLFVHNTFTMANIIEKIQKPTLIISHNKTLAAQLAAEFEEFFPQNAVHYFVSYYDYYQPEAYIPRTDTYIEKDTQINEEIDRLRNAATQSLLSRKDVLIVASVSCIYGLGNPANYLELSLNVKKGQSLKRDKLIRRLTDLQFHRNDIDLQRATYRVQGDVVEIILSSEDTIIRMDFFGDVLENIERLDAISGHKIENLDEFTIFPAKHFVTPEDKLKEATENIRLELTDRLTELKGQGKILEAARLEQRTNFDLEMLTNTGFVAGIENYSRVLEGREPGSPPSTLIDYFPDDFLLFLDESHQTVPQIGAMYEGDKSRKTTLVDYGFRLPSALDNRPLKFNEFEKKINQVIFVSATPASFEIERSLTQRSAPIYGLSGKADKSARYKDAIVEQIIRPTGLIDPTIEIKPIKNQVDDLIERIKERINKHHRVLVATLTKRMAEELAEYLKEEGIKVQYLHSDVDTFERLEILRDLRLGVYDVLVGINLLREGLDLPEVSLVAILDADKEGFLRSETFFMQMMGRAARHMEGHVVMYADKITGSMKRAIDETTRRRALQEAYNKKHGITPKSIQKAIGDSRMSGSKAVAQATGLHDGADVTKMSKEEIKFYVDELQQQMDLAAQNLEFELAARLRDRIAEINKISKLKNRR